MANVLSTAKRVQIVSALVEGVSVRATARMFDVSKDTVMKLGVELGEACARYQDETLRDLPCRCLQVDEVWSFVYSKQKNVPQDRLGEFGVGDVWTFTAIDAETKLIPSFLIGTRDAGCATEFVDEAFQGAVDFAQLVKMYGADATEGEKRYSPAVCIGCERTAVTGQPDPKHVSTSYIERSNLTVRMSVRRFTRLTNAFSKKLRNHAAAVALFTAHYNFCRIHQTLRVTPCMAAGVTTTVWSIADLVGLLPAGRARRRPAEENNLGHYPRRARPPAAPGAC